MQDFIPMDRRSLLGRALTLVGATAVGSISPEVFARAAAKAKPNLDPATFTALSAVADTIVPRTDTPGAIDARVPAKLDAMLVTWASPEHRALITTAIMAIDTMAKGKTGKSFAELDASKRKELLVPYDVAALAPVPRTDGLNGLAALLGDPSVADRGYAKLKELIVILYYYSEEALTTELAYEQVPGDWTPSIKVTPETRATGGAGPF